MNNDVPNEAASPEERRLPAVPGAPRKLFLMPPAEVAQHIAIALAVIKPPIQFGRGRQLPNHGDRDRREAAEAIVKHSERCGIQWYIRQAGPSHSS